MDQNFGTTCFFPLFLKSVSKRSIHKGLYSIPILECRGGEERDGQIVLLYTSVCESALREI